MSSAATQRVYHVMQRGRRYGPLSRVELSTRVLTNDMLVWREGMTEWVPIGTIDELRPYVRHAAAGAGTAPPTFRPGAEVQPPASVSVPPVPVPGDPAPIAVSASQLATTIGRINIVLGILGLVVWPLALMTEPVDEVVVANAAIIAVRPGARIVDTALTVLGVLVSVPLLAAGLGLVRRRVWGRIVAIASACSCLLLQLAIVAFTFGYLLLPMLASAVDQDTLGTIVGYLARSMVTCGYHAWQLVAMRAPTFKASLH
jgi:hypothetical protein